jgi:hypothetical protein
MRRMFGVLAGCLMIATLAACNQVAAGISAFNYFTGVTVTQTDMDKAVAAYDLVVLIPLNNYRYTDPPTYKTPRRFCTDSQPFTILNPCAKASVINLVQPYVAKSEAARRNLQECLDRVGGCSGVKALVAAFQGTWDAAQKQIEAQVAANKP